MNLDMVKSRKYVKNSLFKSNLLTPKHYTQLIVWTFDTLTVFYLDITTDNKADGCILTAIFTKLKLFKRIPTARTLFSRVSNGTGLPEGSINLHNP